ncbi:MAG: AMP-binding protein [Rhodobacteraceae bacterium]|nr:AMP-binding protein [Paracoccaceae bacterium]MBR9823929.1 AMP-binding protein [Paracoccaceae bacterium]
MATSVSDTVPDLLWGYLDRVVEAEPGRTALVHSEGRITYGELQQDATNLARGLVALGVTADDTVSFQLPNWIETATIVLAVMRIGAICNPIIPIYREREVRFITGEARSKVIFVPETYRGFDHAALVAPIARDLGAEMVVCRGSRSGQKSYDDLLELGRRSQVEIRDPDPDADALYLYTSGTEGNPKGVRHSQRTLLDESRSVIEATELTGADTLFMGSPLSHITGFMYASISGTVLGAKVCLQDIWDVPTAVSLIETEGCSWTVGATPFLQGLLEFPEPERLGSLRKFRCGGADVPPHLIRIAQERGIRAMRTYGCSEHPTISGNVSDNPAKAATTDGRVHRRNAVRIVDVDDESRILAVGEKGEIQSRGPEVFLGYVDATLDQKAFTPDGWLRTGDLGTLDADGYVTVTGRKKDIIIRKGENISAKEIEDAILEMPAISQCAVIGVPDTERGEMMVACCVPRAGQRPTLADITAHLSVAGFAKQKYPERLVRLEALPMNAAGKIRKVELREAYTGSQQQQ